MATNIIIVILITSLATYLSRFLGVVSAEKIKETSKMFRWFNCLAYSTLAALIARIVIFPYGVLSEIDYLIRFIVVILSIVVFYLTKKSYLSIGLAILLILISLYSTTFTSYFRYSYVAIYCAIVFFLNNLSECQKK